MNRTFGLNGLVFAQPIADIFSTFLAVYLLLKSLKRANNSVKNIETV